MLRQQSLLLSLLVTLFVSISTVWAKNVTVTMDDKRLTFSNSTYSSDWNFEDTGMCSDQGGISYTYTKGATVRFRFNGTAAYVVFAEYYGGAPTNLTIDDGQASVKAVNKTLSIFSDGCSTRTLFATNLTNTNHTITVSYAGTSASDQTVLQSIIYDDGGDAPKADPTATRATVTISDTGASSASPTSAAANESSGCGTGCKTASISGTVGTILAILFWIWCFRACCCARRTEVTTVVVAARPPSPKPQPIILLAATYEVQQTHIQLNRVERDSVVTPAPPAYAAEQTNYK